MTLNKILVDSSYLYAFFDEKNRAHNDAVSVGDLLYYGPFRTAAYHANLHLRPSRFFDVPSCSLRLPGTTALK